MAEYCTYCFGFDGIQIEAIAIVQVQLMANFFLKRPVCYKHFDETLRNYPEDQIQYHDLIELPF